MNGNGEQIHCTFKTLDWQLWLMLNFNPVRPSEVSATEEKRKAAQERAYEAAIYLRSKDWLIPVAGCSGNSYHLLYPIALPNDRDSSELLEKVRKALAFVLADDKVELDISIYNAARIRKGTVAGRGDDVPGRSHHRSEFLEVPSELTSSTVVNRQMLEAVAFVHPGSPSGPDHETGAGGTVPSRERSTICSIRRQLEQALLDHHRVDR